jgi:hypothetical protein
MLLVRTSSTSLKFAETSVSLPCSRKTTFLLCSPSWSALGCCCRLRVWREDICEFREERSRLMMYVSSLISRGRSSKSVLRLATGGPSESGQRRDEMGG